MTDRENMDIGPGVSEIIENPATRIRLITDLSPETSTLPAPQSPLLACQECLAAAEQDAGRGGRASCDARESGRGRGVMATTGSGCGAKERPLAAGRGEEAGG